MPMRTILLLAAPLVATCLAAAPGAQEPAVPIGPPSPPVPLGGTVTPRIRDITRLHNTMPHLVTGVGVVTGLQGTGATDRGTRQSILNFLREQGLNLTIAEVTSGNTAMVSLTASVPPFAKQGTPIAVKAQSIGDAVSLRGGQLLRAELHGVDGLAHVVVQGALEVGGFAVRGQNAQVEKNPGTSGWIHSGGFVIRDVDSSFFSESGALELRVANPSPLNAASIAAGVRGALAAEDVDVSAVDPTLVRIAMPAAARTGENAVRLLNLIGDVRVEVENPARIVIDQTTGAVLAGAGVLISPCVVGLTELTVSIADDEEVVQPNPFAGGDTAFVGRTRIDVTSDSTDFKPVAGGASVSDLLQNLRALGLTPAQLITVFESLHDGGFLHAELLVR